MALSEFETARARKVLGEFIDRRRPPSHLRDEIDIDYRITGQSVEVVTIRPAWDRPNEKIESAVAKATFVRSRQVWRIYWKRADLKWHLYEPAAEVGQLSEFVHVVDEDAHGCFWG